jgi:hypothetical protein
MSVFSSISLDRNCDAKRKKDYKVKVTFRLRICSLVRDAVFFIILCSLLFCFAKWNEDALSFAMLENGLAVSRGGVNNAWNSNDLNWRNNIECASCCQLWSLVSDIHALIAIMWLAFELILIDRCFLVQCNYRFSYVQWQFSCLIGLEMNQLI